MSPEWPGEVFYEHRGGGESGHLKAKSQGAHFSAGQPASMSSPPDREIE
jgi:hypothetical protein